MAEPSWYHGKLEDWPRHEIALAVVILTATVVTVASCISHMAATWMLRGDFHVAAR